MWPDNFYFDICDAPHQKLPELLEKTICQVLGRDRLCVVIEKRADSVRLLWDGWFEENGKVYRIHDDHIAEDSLLTAKIDGVSK